ncbi:MAG: glutathione peroxidase [FCB group bacterium]|nr:glutathione peroxidase [FCB group bacterium]
MQLTEHRQINFNTISGGQASLENFKGNVLLIVNTASKCGFTKQYAGLEKLYRDNQKAGLIVIGFPSNDFGGQEPGSDEEILNFCQKVYEVTFPMMSKTEVVGENKHPLFKYLTEEPPLGGDIKWNFSKFLLDRDGNLVARFASKIEPDDPELLAQIDQLLKSTP